MIFVLPIRVENSSLIQVPPKHPRSEVSRQKVEIHFQNSVLEALRRTTGFGTLPIKHVFPIELRGAGLPFG